MNVGKNTEFGVRKQYCMMLIRLDTVGFCSVISLSALTQNFRNAFHNLDFIQNLTCLYLYMHWFYLRTLLKKY